jgi:hypothetical protein
MRKHTPISPARDSGPAGRHVVSDAAAANAVPAADAAADAPTGGDWLGELQVRPVGAARPPPGVAVSTRPRGDLHKGRTVESKRRQQGG